MFAGYLAARVTSFVPDFDVQRGWPPRVVNSGVVQASNLQRSNASSISRDTNWGHAGITET